MHVIVYIRLEPLYKVRRTLGQTDEVTEESSSALELSTLLIQAKLLAFVEGIDSARSHLEEEKVSWTVADVRRRYSH